MLSGPCWSRFCRAARRGGAAGGVITGWWSAGGVSGGCGRVRRGGIWPGSTGTGRPSAAGTGAGSGDGTWVEVLDGPRRGCDEAGARAWTVAADATVVRAHQPAAGARHAPPPGTGPARLAVAVLSAPGGAGAEANHKNAGEPGR